MNTYIRRIALASMALLALSAPIVGIRGTSYAAGSNSLGVNPRRDYTIQSGQTKSDTLTVTNLSKTDDLTVGIDLIDFSAKNETGAPSLILDSSKETRWSLKPYAKFPKSVNVPAGKSVQIPFSITIPKNLGAGSYYGAVRYTSGGTADNSKNLSLTSSTATLVFVRVPGEANDALRILTFGAFTPNADASSGTFGKMYVGSAPKYLAYRIVNTGNVAEQPNGSVELKNIFSKKVKIFDKANPNGNIVLIDQTRRFDLCLNESTVTAKDPRNNTDTTTPVCNPLKLAPGRYTARLALVYGDNGSSQHELSYVSSFWYLPTWFIIVVVVVILFLIALGWLIKRAFAGKRYANKRR